MDNVFNLTYHVCKDGEGVTVKGRVEFHHDPEQYGNGYSMYIQSSAEAFGGQGYDIRYDKQFNPENMIGYIVNYFAARYDGKNGRWKLIGIRVWESEE